MTDLAPSADATRSCPNCGMQNGVTDTACAHCGTTLPPMTGRDDERGDLEVIEVERAVGSLGYDAEFRVDGDDIYCPNCGAMTKLSGANIESVQRATDTATGGTDNEVVTVTCPECGTSGHSVVRVSDEQ
jgi:predicted RNA-binding Zn-ribbon protein involved in translation (DUF1610 family)